jgi:hypothetical protein
LCAARAKASAILDEAEALLDPVSDIDGLMLACLVDARLAQAVEDHGPASPIDSILSI